MSRERKARHDRLAEAQPFSCVAEQPGKLQDMKWRNGYPYWETICPVLPATRGQAIVEMKRRGLTLAWLWDGVERTTIEIPKDGP